MVQETTPEMNASSSEAEEEKEEQPKVEGEKDPDFSQVTPQRYSNKVKAHATYMIPVVT